MLTFGSVFCGIGGFDIGFERAQMQCAWQVENDDYAIRVLEKRWPSVQRWKDVRNFLPTPDWRVDVICGGFPCKQTSTAAAIHGYRNGLAGRDSGLWFEFVRIVRDLKPAWVVVENVGGASTWKATIAGCLADLGYKVPGKPLELSAGLFGAPHLRRRLVWIADRNGAGLEITRQGGPSEAESRAWRTPDGNPWLATLGRAVRMDDGVPNRLDRRKRIERLGNAIMPVQSEWIGRQIVNSSETRAR